jgi:hypothetical protein
MLYIVHFVQAILISSKKRKMFRQFLEKIFKKL